VCVTQCVFSKLMQDRVGDTPLITACQCGHVETARVLLDHGANVDQQNNVSSRIRYFLLNNNMQTAMSTINLP
jgi:ankyrin repeat protein